MVIGFQKLKLSLKTSQANDEHRTSRNIIKMQIFQVMRVGCICSFFVRVNGVHETILKHAALPLCFALSPANTLILILFPSNLLIPLHLE
jgi:hypothetical protein